jgi:hypothetical protein
MKTIRISPQATGPWLIGVGLAFSLILMCACTPPISHLAEAQAVAATVAPPSRNKYLLGPEDVLEVSLWKEPDLTKQLIVRPDGKITYPLIGEVQATFCREMWWRRPHCTAKLGIYEPMGPFMHLTA